MFKNRHLGRVRELFSDQFEADGSDFHYRRSLKGPPIKVSETERDHFVAKFMKEVRLYAWGSVSAIILLIPFHFWFGPDVDSPYFDAFIYGGMLLIISGFVLGIYRAWGAPARALARRPTLGVARSGAEVRRMMLAKTTYGQHALGVAAMMALLLKASEDTNILQGLGRLWIVFAGGASALILFQAFRKWQLERSSVRQSDGS